MSEAVTSTRAFRYHDLDRDRIVTASPNLFAVWRGRRPGRTLIAGPFKLEAPIRSMDELLDAYRDWMEQGEPR